MSDSQSTLHKLLDILEFDDNQSNASKQTVFAVLQSLLKTTPLTFIYENSDQECMECNEAFSVLFQVPLVTAGLPVQSVLTSFPKVIELILLTIQEEREYRSRLIYIEREDRLLHILVDAKKVTDREGTVLGWLFIFREIESLPTLESEILRNDRLITVGKVAAGIAHEIRNPLTSVLGFLQLLDQSWNGQAMEREKGYLEVMMKEIAHVDHLIEQLQLLANPPIIIMSKCDLNQLVRDVGLLYESEAGSQNVTIRYQTKEVPPVNMDVDMLKQVLFNLIRNALDAMEEGGELTLMTAYDEHDNCVEISVSDTGPGIPAILSDRIFDAFFTTKEHGAGLGLAICRRLVHECGGQIRYQSKGFGATFTVLLPPCLRRETS